MQQNNNPFEWKNTEIKIEKSIESIKIEDAIFNTFSSKDGKIVLEWLKNKFESPRTSYPELGINGVFYSYQRGGQIEVVKAIETKIKNSINRRKGQDK